MEQFPHLKFAQKVTGKPRFFGGGENEISKRNAENRQGHSSFLSQKANVVKSDWEFSLLFREIDDLAPINDEIVPVFIQINPDLLNIPGFDLQAFGIEIISEEDDGFIIGASLDNLHSLEAKIVGFVREEHGAGKIADFWNIIDGNREEWKPQHILSAELYSKWQQIRDDELYKIEVGVAFDRPLQQQPDPDKQGGAKRLERFQRAIVDRDDQLMQRQNHFEEFIKYYGEITSSFLELEDSFSCEVKINGKGLKD
jgi:hypothetical protein